MVPMQGEDRTGGATAAAAAGTAGTAAATAAAAEGATGKRKGSSGSGSGRGKLTLQQKYELITKAEAGALTKDLVAKYGINRASICKLKKKAGEIKKDYASGSVPKDAKRLRKETDHLKGLDDHLREYVSLARRSFQQANIPVSNGMLKVKANKFAEGKGWLENDGKGTSSKTKLPAPPPSC